MGLYLGNSERLKIHLDNATFCLNFYSEIPIINGVVLLSSDNYTLKDTNGLYLTAKDGE